MFDTISTTPSSGDRPPLDESDEERAARHERERLESNERHERERKAAGEVHERERLEAHDRGEEQRREHGG